MTKFNCRVNGELIEVVEVDSEHEPEQAAWEAFAELHPELAESEALVISEVVS